MDFVNRCSRKVALAFAAMAAVTFAVGAPGKAEANPLRYKAKIVVHNNSQRSLVLQPENLIANSTVMGRSWLNTGKFSSKHAPDPVIQPGETSIICVRGYGTDGLDFELQYREAQDSASKVNINGTVGASAAVGRLNAWFYGVFASKTNTPKGYTRTRHDDRYTYAEVFVK